MPVKMTSEGLGEGRVLRTIEQVASIVKEMARQEGHSGLNKEK